jgi:hypothetical protein
MYAECIYVLNVCMYVCMYLCMHVRMYVPDTQQSHVPPQLCYHKDTEGQTLINKIWL